MRQLFASAAEEPEKMEAQTGCLHLTSQEVYELMLTCLGKVNCIKMREATNQVREKRKKIHPSVRKEGGNKGVERDYEERALTFLDVLSNTQPESSASGGTQRQD